MSTDDTWLLKIDSFDKFMSKFSSIKIIIMMMTDQVKNLDLRFDSEESLVRLFKVETHP